ncbi:MAG: TRAP transporter substrate-binding protein [Betaproteobacteria bacterium]|nr:TRAP transporter substrate-binding protein [Betaproteobacteria bacterium]
MKLRFELASVLIALWMVSAGAVAQTFTMKLSTSTNGDAINEWFRLLKQGVEARAGGRIKIEIYPASQLGSIPRTIEGVALGTIELSMNASGFYESLEPRFSVFAAPGLFDDIYHANRLLSDPEIKKRLATFGATKGVEALSMFTPSVYAILSHRPIATLADLKGQKIRVPGSPLQIEAMRRLGASPLSMAFGEVLPALQNRTIDAVWAALPLFNALKYYDIAKTATNLPASWAVAVGLVNRNFMKSLGPELEAIVREEAGKADAAVLPWTAEDIARTQKAWASQGGKELNLSAADAKRFLDESIAATAPLLAATPQQKDDYQALDAAARKHRK